MFLKTFTSLFQLIFIKIIYLALSKDRFNITSNIIIFCPFKNIISNRRNLRQSFNRVNLLPFHFVNIMNLMQHSLLKKKFRLKFTKAEIFQKHLIFLKISYNFQHLSDPHNGRILLKVIFFLKINILCQYMFILFRCSFNPMIYISQFTP